MVKRVRTRRVLSRCYSEKSMPTPIRTKNLRFRPFREAGTLAAGLKYPAGTPSRLEGATRPGYRRDDVWHPGSAAGGRSAR